MSYTMICAIFHILGIFIAKDICLTDIFMISALCIVLSLIIGIFKKRINTPLILAFIMLSIGGVSYTFSSYNRLYEAFPDKYVTITGTIVSSKMTSSGEYCNKYILSPDSVSYQDKTMGSDRKITLRTKIPYRYGDIVEVRGFLSEFDGPDNEFEYDYAQSYKSKGIYNQVMAMEAKKIGEINRFDPRFWVGSVKNFVHETIFGSYGGEKSAIYNAILLGDKSYLSNEYKIKLLRTGVWQSLYSPYIHILLISMIAGLFHSSKKKNRMLFIMLAMYALINIGDPNALKASLLAASIIACRVIFGYSDKAQQLSFLVLALSIVNPMLCFNRGFIMSVASTIVIILFYPAVSELLSKALHIKNFKLISFLSIAITLIVGCFPLTCLLFNGSAFYSTIITTFMVPVILAIVVISLFYIPALAIFSSGGFLKPVMDPLLSFIEKLPSFIERIPGHYIFTKTPSMLQVITAYLILWLIIHLIAKKKRDDIFKALSAVTLAFILCISFFEADTGLEIYFVNVGQGDSSVLKTSKGETILIDGGGAPEYQTSDYNVGDSVLVPYLISHGLSEIDYAVVTHFHKDHAEGVVSAVKNLSVRNIVMPDSNRDSEYRLELEQLSKDKGINIIYAEKGGMLSFDSGLTLRFLAPDPIQRQSSEPNDTAIVIQADYFRFRGLFTSDSTDIIDDEYPEYVSLLKVAHHGSKTQNSRQDIHHLCPEFAVISVGKDNPYALPDDSVIDALNSVNSEIFRTDIHGDIQFKIYKSGKISYTTLREE